MASLDLDPDVEPFELLSLFLSAQLTRNLLRYLNVVGAGHRSQQGKRH
jgi:hypothetical protein